MSSGYNAVGISQGGLLIRNVPVPLHHKPVSLLSYCSEVWWRDVRFLSTTSSPSELPTRSPLSIRRNKLLHFLRESSVSRSVWKPQVSTSCVRWPDSYCQLEPTFPGSRTSYLPPSTGTTLSTSPATWPGPTTSPPSTTSWRSSTRSTGPRWRSWRTL